MNVKFFGSVVLWKRAFACAFVLCALAAERAPAQYGEGRVFQRISRQNGLSNEEIYCIAQDRRGVMWFGTADGLNKYDGVRCTAYRHKEGDSSSLPQNTVVSVGEDNDGVLWVGTKDYLSCFHPATGTFTSYRLPTNYTLENVNSIRDGGDSYLYLAVGSGIMRFDKGAGRAEIILNEDKVSFNAQIHIDSRLRLWFLGGNSISLYDAKRKTLQKRVVRPIIYCALPSSDSQGRLWFADPDGFHVFDPATERLVRTYPAKSLPSSFTTGNAPLFRLLAEASDGAIWFQAAGNVYALNPESGTTLDYTREIYHHLGGSGLMISALRDRANVLWLGDNARGVVKWSPYLPKFALWRHNPLDQKTLSNDYIRSIWESGDNPAHSGKSANSRTLWVCTQYKGLNAINRETGVIRRYEYNPKNPRSGLVFNDLWGICALASNKLLLYRHMGSQILDVRSGVARLTTLHPMVVVFRDNDGVLWTRDSIGGTYFTGEIIGEEARFRPFASVSSEHHRLDAMAHDRRGRVWFAQYRAFITRFHKETRRWDTLKTFPALRNANGFTALMEDQKGSMWIGTKGDGVYICDPEDRVRNIAENDGLPNNNVYGILEDARGGVWISSDKGLSRYNPETKTFRNYKPNDGLQGWEFNRMAFFKNTRGEMFFGGTEGLNMFHPDSLRDNPHAPPLLLASLRILGEPFDSARAALTTADGKNIPADMELADARSVRLSHDRNTIAFGFAALDYTAPELNLYSWKLEGYDENWSAPAQKTEVSYMNLPPGDYVFRVRACNSDGVWNDEGLSIAVVIEPPWYARWQFYIACAFALSAAVFGIVRVRVRAVETRNRLLEIEIHNRTKELVLANGEIQRQLEIQDEQAREIELRNSELDETLRNLKITQTQLVHSERMNAIGMLTAGVMHEINNPNAIVYAAVAQTRGKLRELGEYFFSLLDEETKRSAEAQQFDAIWRDASEHLELAAEGAQRIRIIVMNLQGFTKHQEEGGKTANLAKELRSTVDLFRLQFKHVAVHFALPDEISLTGNFGELNQVFLNILVNAAQADANAIAISAEIKRDNTSNKLELRFADDGIGMSEAALKKIFEPFFSTKDSGNSGLGLSISKQIVERHGGTLECQSDPGQGTTFILRFPV
jgi:signal transduction histidine kinase/streptogramin lyase